MRFLFFAGILLLATAAKGQDSAVQSDTVTISFTEKESTALPDSMSVMVRTFDNSLLEELRASGDFNYKQPPTVAESLWQRFLTYIGELIQWLFERATQTNWGQVLIYALGLILLAAVIMLLLKVDAFRVFYSGADKGALTSSILHENIHALDFDYLIGEAMAKKEYRSGIRLTFLFALKLLSDKQYVDWKPGKTNHEYADELMQQDLKTGFNELSFYFDYAWYGEFAVNESLFERVQNIFANWRKKVE